MEKKSNINDYLQGIRNCPPQIIPVACAGCNILDRRANSVRKYPGKPRCSEPNFLGPAALKGVNDKGFDHANAFVVFYNHLCFMPKYHCVCGKDYFRVKFNQSDKFHFPTMILSCICGREKTIIILSNRTDLRSPWLNKRNLRMEFDLRDEKSVFDKTIECICGSEKMGFYFEKNGFSFYPSEGSTIGLSCKKCKRGKKIFIDAIDDTEPWLFHGDRLVGEKIIVRKSPADCPDLIIGEEKMFLVAPPPL